MSTTTTTTLSVKEFLTETINSHQLVIFSKSYCPHSNKAKFAIHKLRVIYHSVEVDNLDKGEELLDELEALTGQRKVPIIFIDGEFVGDVNKFLEKIESGEVQKKLGVNPIPWD
ncbi:glutaredoxin-domain-containing protein [Conidiobolus coronatus NRRL 28638]|uniref:Glutaredoxin-domain-containing protein n=1 Tax=Conidiobolus coronatus (strain ATCC 28846 / CBS 209.66 / NRRL 28638) TaxID=796925 RepID=A0A137PF22_CONC2|nr:glutaredoxin-domain-containing protein [Conidiobolus coronatus NRRL 28638]|eukprot:KXN73590.1 glutaredoxin-domain-containing protein [Conidiobolus coronatus NRRL 28638]